MNELSIYDKIADPLTACERMGAFFASSGMFGCTKPEQGMVLAMTCLCERKSPVEVMRTYHLMDGGKMAMKADAMLAKFHERGGDSDWIQFDTEAAIAEFTYKGKTKTIGFRKEDAIRAGLLKSDGSATKPGSNWDKWPDAMLRARCISKAVRMLCPEVNFGVYEEGETEDIAPTPAPKTRKAPLPEITIIETKDESPMTLSEKRESVKYLAQTIEGEKAVEWLLKNQWIDQGQSEVDLDETSCDRILNAPDKWVQAVITGKAAPKGKGK